MTRYERSDGFQGAEFVDVDMSRSSFREVDLSGARMRGVALIDADIDGAIDGLRLNGVEVAPLVEAELDRLHPERTKLRPTTPDGMREAWTVVESFWSATMARAETMSDADLHRSVDDEWSFAETLRHLIFVTDAWLGHAVLGQASPFHPVGLPASFLTNGADFGIDPQIAPSIAEVARVRAVRMAQVRDFLAAVTQDDLDRVRGPNQAPGFPPPAERTAIDCLHVLFNDEWWHHHFAVRDLDLLDRERAIT